MDRILRAKELFFGAAELPRAELEEYLHARCGGDPELEAEVRALLAHADYQPPSTDRWSSGLHTVDLAARPETIGAYRILGVLGEGGMGVVYRAEQQSPVHREIALKVIRSGLASRAALARFDVERQALAAMNHHCIAKVLDAGATEAGEPWLAMELVDGTAITTFCDAERMGIEDRLRLMLAVCAGVQHAHQKGVVHRDLKPANVLVTRAGEQILPKIVDFGLAKPIEGAASMHAAQTLGFQVLGTPEYMAPEQVQAAGTGGHVDSRADLYSLGVILCELLTGEVPFRSDAGSSGGVDFELLRRVAEEEPRRPSELVLLTDAGERAAHRAMSPNGLRRALRGDLDNIVLQALAKDPDGRYASAGELALDIQRSLDDEPVRATAQSTTYRLGKFIRKHRVAVAATALVILSLAIGLIIAFDARNRAEGYLADFDRLSYVVRLERTLAKQERLYPPWPANVAPLQRWLEEDARSMELALEDLRAAGNNAPRSRGDRRSEAGLFLAETLESLVHDLERFQVGAVVDARHRLQWAERVASLTIDRHMDRWLQARSAIRQADGVVASRRYAEHPIDLEPQMGLVPIGMNPDTGLWEFYHLRSAFDPAGDTDPGELGVPDEVDNATLRGPGRGMTFVLVPGGRFIMGSQRPEGMAAAEDPLERSADEMPAHEVELAPYFLSKYEMTQGQWARLTGGEYPSFHPIGTTYPATPEVIGEAHPVEAISWVRADEVLRRYGLSLPTEAQWERACRGGTSTAWSTGNTVSSLEGFANVHDRDADVAPRWGPVSEIQDGYRDISPVGAYASNPFGLHDVHGNVFEWCRDWWGSYTLPVDPSDGFRQVPEPERRFRIARGATYRHTALRARSAARGYTEARYVENHTGVRPARRVLSSTR